MAATQRGGRRRPPTANPKAAIEDWLNLVDPDGAFLTISELSAVFPHGFDPMPPDRRAELRARVADLDGDPAGRGALRDWLLGTVLDWDDLLADGQRLPATSSVYVAEHRATLRPTQALLDVDDPNTVRVAVFTWPLGTRLDRRTDVSTAGDTWPASPTQRAEAWCREAGVPLALVTDDDQWVLVWAPRGAPAASCRWSISDVADERILQAGVVSLMGARRFFAVEEPETLENLFVRAADAEAEITKGLGSSVRRSVELLVAAISRDDVAKGGAVLADVAATETYEAAVTVLMRLVFLLFAEERRLLPAEDPLWAESYSVLTLRDDLRTAAARDGIDALERRSTAWHRLLATFRAVHGGVNHDRLTLPAYGGSLFDPQRFPFLEGRRSPDGWVVDDARGRDDAADPAGVPSPAAGTSTPVGSGHPVAIDDRTVLAILDALLTIEVRSGRSTVAQRVSYKALDVEQIGHCYEGLLDHGCAPVDELALGLVGPEGNEPEMTVTELEHRLGGGVDAFCEWLGDKDRCNRRPAALAKDLAVVPAGVELARLRVACGHDDATVERVLPFWGLIRPDLRGLPVVLLPGSQFVTQTSTRRNTGAQYTTKTLAEEVVTHTLAPLVYEPGPHDEPDEQRWRLRTPAEIIGLRVCDPAVGSGAILTAAGRYLADRLVEAVGVHGPGTGPFADRLADLAAAPAEEQVTLARREIVDHCLYGVDKNPVAAEMAKLSLWLTTMARERPFTFLDHAIQTGDSLLGITRVDQLEQLHLDPAVRGGEAGFQALSVGDALAAATRLAAELQAVSVVTVRDADNKRRLHERLRRTLADLSVVADAVTGAGLATSRKTKWLSKVDFARQQAGQEIGDDEADNPSLGGLLDRQSERIRDALDPTRTPYERDAALAALAAVATGWLRTDLPDEPPMPWDRVAFHWPLRFPEVFLAEGRSGFDAIVGNPPFLGGQRISGAMGEVFREYLVTHVAAGAKGSADLVTYFVLLACTLARSVGLLATNTISQGDTREVGLDRLTAADWTVHRAVKSEPWPNEANLEIAKVWLWSGGWTGRRLLGGQVVRAITASLEQERRVTGTPHRLAANAKKSFQGSNLWGGGFVTTASEAAALIEHDPRNADVLFPYLNGADLNDHPRQEASRWVINFFDWPEDKAREYPSCFEIVERLVRPGRMKINRARNRDRWWIYGETRPGLYAAIAGLDRVLAIARVSKTVMPVLVATGQVLNEKVVVFPAVAPWPAFGLLSSALHWQWAWAHSSTLRTDLNYSPTDVFETFPQPVPQRGPAWERIGEAGAALDGHRSQLMVDTNLGLTKTYNRVHNPDEHDPAVVTVRNLHVALDEAVLDAYGWSDLALDHHHWATPQGVRFTVCEAAKDELLDRLLELNQLRYAAEVAAGLHDKTKPKPKAPRKPPNPNQATLL